MAGVCVGQSCTPGATSCSGAKVQKCSLTGLEWSPEQDCAKLGFTCKAGACVPALCGDGVVQPPETCDDGNSKEGDGCGAGCQSETVWQELLVEDFEDAKAQDWTTYKGGCGWQGAKAVDGAMVWSMNSDWAGMRRELPKVGASYGAYEAEVRLVNTQGKAWIGFRAKSLSWNENDKGGYNFQLSPDGHVLFCTGNGCSNQVKLPLAIGLWTTLRVEEDLKAQTWQARMDGKLMASGSLGAISGSGGLFALHVNGKCDSERLQVQQVRVLGAK
ncbi:MAG: DUF4215 domain-containing protein [Myxococcales bacterium]|nr:DUF4215 domain-containing protein [Myxococcales bacterium]